MKVLHVTPRYLPCLLTGSEMYMRYLSEGLTKMGNSVTVLTSNSRNLEGFIDPIRGRFIDQAQTKINNVEIIRFKTQHFVSLPMFTLQHFVNLKAILPRNLYDSLYIFSTGPFLQGLYPYVVSHSSYYDLMHCTPFPLTIDYLAARGALKVNLPLVITPFFHFENPAFYNHYLSDLLKRANAVFACTNIEKKKIVELGVKSSKIHVIPMGIEPTEWTNASGARFKEKYGLEGSYIVFFAGTKSYDKGAISLLRAMRIVQKKKKNVVLVTAGFGFREWLREKEKLKDVRILDLTYLSGGDKYDAFDACDIFAMPSRSDAFGISYLEAWICGKPVIGCKAGATPEVIQDGADGLLVGFGEVKELAERILYLLENPGFSEDLGTRGKEFVLSNYTWKSIVEKVEGIYRNTINEHRKML